MKLIQGTYGQRSRQRARGVVAIEMVFLFGILTTLAVGISELGRAFYQYDTLTKSVRNAARYLTQYSPGDTARISEARCLVVYGKTACQGTALVPGLTEQLVTVCDRVSCPNTHNNRPTGRGVVNLVTVSITGFKFATAITLVIPKQLTFAPITATMAQISP